MKTYLLLGENLAEYRTSISTSRQSAFQRLVQQSYRYTGEDLPTSHPAKSTTYMGMAIINLSLSYLLTKQKGYLEEASRWMETVCNYDKWGNAHLVDVDLSASWILMGLSLGYDWLYDDLPAGLKTKVGAKLALQADKMYSYREKFYGTSWTTEYWQNHNWINHASLYVVGLVLAKNQQLPQAQAWLGAARENFAKVFAGLPEDGSDYEGAVYWRYGVFWLFVFAELAKQQGDTDYFATSGFLRNTFYYRLYQSNGDLSQQVGFGDCHDRYSSHSPAMYYLMAHAYQDGYPQALGNLVINKYLYEEAYNSKVKPGIMPEAAFEFLFYDPMIAEKNIADLPLTRNFPDLGLAYMRSSWASDAVIYSTKCSAPGGAKQWHGLNALRAEGIEAFGLGHHHPDNNSFVLIANGEFLAVDEGYNRAATAGDHNMILVDGQGYENEGVKNIYPAYDESMVGYQKLFKEDQENVIVVGETAQTYAKVLALEKLQRTSIFHKGIVPFVVLVDVMKSKEKHRYTWQLQTDWLPADLTVEQHESTASYQINRSNFEVRQWASQPVTGTLTEKTHKEIMTTQEPDNYRQIALKRLRISTTVATNENIFVTIIVPQKLAEQKEVKLNVNQPTTGQLDIQCQVGTQRIAYQVDLTSGDFLD